VTEASLHSVAGPGGVSEAAVLAATHPALVGPFERIVARVSGAAELLEDAAQGLPTGPAQAEGIAVRLRRRGVALRWEEPDRLSEPRELLELCRARGRSSVELMRNDPGLLTELQLGAWCQAGFRHRLARRAPLPRRGRVALLRAAAERAFWSGVRSAATRPEWRSLTASYCALVYHRLAGEGKAGQERIDLSPRRFRAQLRLLRILGFRPLDAGELLAFHDGQRPLPRRSFVVTVDDGTADCEEPLARHADVAPQLFVCTSEVGGSAHWLDGEPLLGWTDLEQLARGGVAVGAHARTHRPLVAVEPSELGGEVAGSLTDLRARLPDAVPILAYPHGSHDEAVRAAAIAAGFRAAWTTEKGRNGVGTDRWCLRRISVHAGDGPLAVLWMVVTGEPPPWREVRLPRWRS
jgi:peptidoglycan/xylan/chitin deacetylase (PgdA/CDA1 family)